MLELLDGYYSLIILNVLLKFYSVMSGRFMQPYLSILPLSFFYSFNFHELLFVPKWFALHSFLFLFYRHNIFSSLWENISFFFFLSFLLLHSLLSLSSYFHFLLVGFCLSGWNTAAMDFPPIFFTLTNSAFINILHCFQLHLWVVCLH